MTTVNAVNENEITMAVRISACGSGLALTAMVVSPADTKRRKAGFHASCHKNREVGACPQQ